MLVILTLLGAQRGTGAELWETVVAQKTLIIGRSSSDEQADLAFARVAQAPPSDTMPQKAWEAPVPTGSDGIHLSGPGTRDRRAG